MFVFFITLFLSANIYAGDLENILIGVKTKVEVSNGVITVGVDKTVIISEATSENVNDLNEYDSLCWIGGEIEKVLKKVASNTHGGLVEQPDHDTGEIVQPEFLVNYYGDNLNLYIVVPNDGPHGASKLDRTIGACYHK